MKSQRWLLLAATLSVFIFAGIGSAVVSAAGGVVSAAPTSIQVNGTSVVTATFTPAVSEAVTLTMGTPIGTFSNPATNHNDSVTGTTTLSYTTTSASSNTLTATFTCTQAGTTTFTLTEPGNVTATSGTLTCTVAPTVALSSGSITVGQTIAVKATFQQTSAQTIALATTSTAGTFSSATAGNGESVAGAGSTSLSYTASSAASTTLTGFFLCTQAGTAVFTLSQGGSNTATSPSLTCSAATTTTSTGITLTPNPTALGGTATVTATYTPTLSQAINLSASPALGYFTSGTTTNGDTLTGANTAALSFTSVSATAGTLTASFLCSQAGAVVFTLNQGGTATGTSTALNCGSGNAISVSPALIYAGQTASVLITYTPTAGQLASLSGTYGIGYFPTATSSAGEVIGGLSTPALTYTTNSSSSETLTATYLCSASGTVSFTFTLNGATYATSAPVTCYGSSPYTTTPYTGYNYGTTNNLVTTPVGISTLSATANPASVICGQPATITIFARDAYGAPAADGSQINLSSTGGSLSQSYASTIGGTATATLTPPSSTSAVSVSISGGTTSTSLSIPVSCDTVATSPVAVAPLTAQPVYPPSIAYGTIAPPNTGDGGLLNN